MTFGMPATHHFTITAKCPTHSRTDATAHHLAVSQSRSDVNVTSDASDDRLAQLKSDLSARCPVTVILTQAGSKIDATWNVKRI